MSRNKSRTEKTMNLPIPDEEIPPVQDKDEKLELEIPPPPPIPRPRHNEAPTALAQQNTEDDPTSAVALRKKRYDTRWKQQCNRAFRQEYTFIRILILCTILGVILISLGGVSYYLSHDYPKPIVLDYTNCKEPTTGLECFSNLGDKTPPPSKLSGVNCKCSLRLKIDDGNLVKKGSKIMLMYELENFFQNTRMYKKDVNWRQMEGKVWDKNRPKLPDHCLKKMGDKEKKKVSYPCGKIANSYFSDVFRIYNESSGQELVLDHRGIAWSSDKNDRYKNPKKWKDLPIYFTLPDDWHDQQKVTFLNGSTTAKKGVEDEKFIVWLRSAAFSKFRKKYAYIKGLKKGSYRIEIDYRYEVKSFSGRKRVVIAVDFGSFPIDNFFWIGFGAVGIACLLLGPILCFVDFIFRRAYQSKLRKQSRRESTSESAIAPRKTEPQNDWEQTKANRQSS